MDDDVQQEQTAAEVLAELVAEAATQAACAVDFGRVAGGAVVVTASPLEARVLVTMAEAPTVEGGPASLEVARIPGEARHARALGELVAGVLEGHGRAGEVGAIHVEAPLDRGVLRVFEVVEQDGGAAVALLAEVTLERVETATRH